MDALLFLVHEVSGEVRYASPLAHHIDKAIPVYGLAATPLGAAPLRTMHAEAKHSPEQCNLSANTASRDGLWGEGTSVR